jgi:hypothetical protein
MSLPGALRRVAGPVAALISAAVLAAGCTNAASPPTPPQSASSASGPESYPAEGVPEVVPQPQKMERLGDDVAVRGQRRHDRIPGAAGEALAMHQDERVTAAGPIEGQPGAARRLL